MDDYEPGIWIFIDGAAAGVLPGGGGGDYVGEGGSALEGASSNTVTSIFILPIFPIRASSDRMLNSLSASPSAIIASVESRRPRSDQAMAFNIRLVRRIRRCAKLELSVSDGWPGRLGH